MHEVQQTRAGSHEAQNQNYPSLAVTAPASPVHDMDAHLAEKHTRLTTTNMTENTASIPQYGAMGQFTFGPATQRTITTVTTTTTVSLPPLIMKPPKDLSERDPKQYPLAFLPTPSSISRFCFDADGRSMVFEEVGDPDSALQDYHRTQTLLRRGLGTFRREEKLSGYATPDLSTGQMKSGSRMEDVRASKSLKRATPPSIAEAAELASLSRKSKKPRAQLRRSYLETAEHSSSFEQVIPQFRSVEGNLSPITPDTEGHTAVPSLHVLPGSSVNDNHAGITADSRAQIHLEDTDDTLIADSDSAIDDVEQQAYARAQKRMKKRGHLSTMIPPEDALLGISESSKTAQNRLSSAPLDISRRHLPTTNINIQRDASLPSPSLSPITAAANLASRKHATDVVSGDQNEDTGSVMSGLDLEDLTKTQSTESFKSMPEQPHPVQSQSPQSQHSKPTIMDIQTMLDAFDSMAEGLQSYIMYQFLRRCAKPTLQMIANAVNPALKCDPFSILPPELSLNIIRFLDAKSMCRAAQVSKRWRKLINTDEKAWRSLLEDDNFVLPEGEIARAVSEGWGWQHPGLDGFEQDLNRVRKESTPELPQEITMHSDDETSSTATSHTEARKRSSKAISYNRKSRRRLNKPVASSSWSFNEATQPNNTWLKVMSGHRGANSIAQLASSTDVPVVGLPSLRQMHLFKSLYQRHYLIRKAWMDGERKPQHLAFRAHHRHVVTCLLFDSDKILTGSDDTKINVYDTKTGALRSRLEGHEGGVWALQYDGDILVSGSTDRSVRVWDIKTGRLLQVFQGHTSTVRCLVILKPVQVDTEPDGTPVMMPKEPLIITGSRDSTLRVWKLPRIGDRPIYQAGPPVNDSDNPYHLRTLTGHHNSVRAIAAHGDRLVSGSYDCTVRVWKISTGDLVHRLTGHTQKVYSVVLDHARNRCISGSMDNLVKIWDLQSGTALFNLEGHTSLVGLLDLSDDRLVSAAADSTLRVWDPENGACRATLSAHTGAITCFQHDGQKVISGSDRTLKMWNVRNGECVRDLLTDLSGVWQVRFDERRCVAAVQRNALTYIEVLDFGASREGIPSTRLGRRIVVDAQGREYDDVEPVGELEMQRVPTA